MSILDYILGALVSLAILSSVFFILSVIILLIIRLKRNDINFLRLYIQTWGIKLFILYLIIFCLGLINNSIITNIDPDPIQIQNDENIPTKEEKPQTELYINNKYNISFEYPANWVITEYESEPNVIGNLNTLDITVREPNSQFINEGDIYCHQAYKEIHLKFQSSKEPSNNLLENVPYEADGGLGVFTGTLTPTIIAGNDAFKGLIGDGCMGTDYVVEQTEYRYWIIKTPDISEEDIDENVEYLNNIDMILNSLDLSST